MIYCTDHCYVIFFLPFSLFPTSDQEKSILLMILFLVRKNIEGLCLFHFIDLHLPKPVSSPNQ